MDKFIKSCNAKIYKNRNNKFEALKLVVRVSTRFDRSSIILESPHARKFKCSCRRRRGCSRKLASITKRFDVSELSFLPPSPFPYFFLFSPACFLFIETTSCDWTWLCRKTNREIRSTIFWLSNDCTCNQFVWDLRVWMNLIDFRGLWCAREMMSMTVTIISKDLMFLWTTESSGITWWIYRNINVHFFDIESKRISNSKNILIKIFNN